MQKSIVSSNEMIVNKESLSRLLTCIKFHHPSNEREPLFAN